MKPSTTIITASPILDLQFTKREVEYPAAQYETGIEDKIDFEDTRKRSVIRAAERASKGIKQKYLGKKNPFKRNNMKTILVPLMLVIALAVNVVSCVDHSKDIKRQEAEETINGHTVRTYVADSCEYIVAGYGNVQMMSHKGNCKFCLKRNK